MTDQGQTQRVQEVLFRSGAGLAYAVLDGASATGLGEALFKHQPTGHCLYPEPLAPDMAQVAPYLIQLAKDSPFTRWATEEGWGRHWGVFLTSPEDLRRVRRHFRDLVTVAGPDGKELFFRFYDPRVLQAYLPTCNPAELEAVFGPVISFVMEGANPQVLLRFSREKGKLLREEMKVAPL